MANIVLGIGTSHSPQLGVPGSHWSVFQQKDEGDPRFDYRELLRRASPDIRKELTPEVWQEKDDRCQKAIATVGEVLREVNPDVMLVIGDDQHEQFLDNNLPMLCIYNGEALPVRTRSERRAESSLFPTTMVWQRAEGQRDAADLKQEYPAGPELAGHLIRLLAEEGFDIARSNQLRPEVGIGHAFSFIYRRLLPEGTIPMVPFMVNTFYPPNTPTPRRCYALGQAIRHAVETWQADKRVAVVASGGLSHVVLDEELDRATIDGLMEKDAHQLCSLPVEKLINGTSEIRNWIITGAALEPLEMTLIDYVPTYRTPAGTGCGMTFAFWN